MSANDEQSARRPLLVSVGGGKGGVGKTVIAANLAVALAKQNARVIAVDADLGSANLHTLFGIDRPEQTLQAFVDGKVANLSQIALESGVERLRVIPGSVAVPGAANLAHARKQKLLRHIAKLPADVVMVDCGAGVHYNVVDFFAIADVHLLVATAQLISLQNAYGFLKASLYRRLRQRAAEAGKADLLDRAANVQTEVETVRQLLDRIGKLDRALCQQLQAELAATRVWILGNQLSDTRELQALHALSRMIGDFLSLRAPAIGGLERRDRIHAAVTRRRPFMAELASDPESTLLMRLAASCIELHQSKPAARAADSDASAPGAEPTSRLDLRPGAEAPGGHA